MLFMIYEEDDGDQTDARNRLREAHFAHMEAHAAIVSVGAGLVADDGAQRTGALLIVDVPGLAAAHAFAVADPYYRAGIFRSLTIRKLTPNKWNDHLLKSAS